jgi:dTDP-4-dehydrorhamnose 3,5-epimerase-like enzyme
VEAQRFLLRTLSPNKEDHDDRHLIIMVVVVVIMRLRKNYCCCHYELLSARENAQLETPYEFGNGHCTLTDNAFR